jgi:hypothetical protein
LSFKKLIIGTKISTPPQNILKSKLAKIIVVDAKFDKK